MGESVEQQQEGFIERLMRRKRRQVAREIQIAKRVKRDRLKKKRAKLARRKQK